MAPRTIMLVPIPIIALEGKPKKVCLIAVVRKMIVVIFSVWKNQKEFVTQEKNSNVELSTT